MNWYIDQSVVAVATSSDRQIKKNTDYTIQGICKMPCCGHIMLNVGVLPLPENPSRPATHLACRCGKDHPVASLPAQCQAYSEKYFAPLDMDISELTKQLEEPIELAQ